MYAVPHINLVLKLLETVELLRSTAIWVQTAGYSSYCSRRYIMKCTQCKMQAKQTSSSDSWPLELLQPQSSLWQHPLNVRVSATSCKNQGKVKAFIILSSHFLNSLMWIKNYRMLNMTFFWLNSGVEPAVTRVKNCNNVVFCPAAAMWCYYATMWCFV